MATDDTQQARFNLLHPLPDAVAAEVFTDILRRPSCRIERIVSHGQVTPIDRPWCQDHDEWVLVLTGRATVRMAANDAVLSAGDHLFIPAGVEHRVTFTDPDGPTVWLAIHLGETSG